MTFPGHPSFQASNPLRQPPLGPGEELAGKYRIDRVVGAGAMGVVVLAWHIELEQQVAIKFLYPELASDESGAERFRREGLAAARIRNEHVARVIDVGTLEEPGIPYIVMEYLHGRDLARELAARGRLPVAEAVRYLLEACEAVAEAHTRGVVHRDLKPANLFLAEGSNGQRMVKVLDFGISKVTGTTPERMAITDTAVLMGSPAYMSPEQLESSRNVDGRSDIWSLGVILYELVMGELPFGGDSVPQLVRAIISGARTPLTSRDASLVELDAIVARCLQQDRALRFQNVSELHAALERSARVDRAPHAAEVRATAIGLASPSTSSSAPVAPSIQAQGLAEGDTKAGSLRPGVPESAWGHTQNGRRGSWQRHGVAIGALTLLLGGFGFWLLERGGHAGAGPAERDVSALENARPSLDSVAAPLQPLPAPAALPAPPAASPSSPELLPPPQGGPLDTPPSTAAANPELGTTPLAELAKSGLQAAPNAAAPAAGSGAPGSTAAVGTKLGAGAGAGPSSAPAAGLSLGATGTGAVGAPLAKGAVLPTDPGSAGTSSTNGTNGSPSVKPGSPAAAAAGELGTASRGGAPGAGNGHPNGAASHGDRFEIPEFGGRK